MQGIVGQASDFKSWWPAKCVLWKFDWTLVQAIWWRKIKKIKGDRRAALQYGILREHSSPRTGSIVIQVQLEGLCEVYTLAGMPGLVIVLDTACACRWERRGTFKKRINLKVQTDCRVKTTVECRARVWKRRVTKLSVQKKTPFLAELSMSCKRSLHNSDLQYHCFVG